MGHTILVATAGQGGARGESIAQDGGLCRGVYV